MNRSLWRWSRALHVIWALGWADFSMKYRGSIFGYFWSFMAPLSKFVVILFVFKPFVGSDIPQYPLYLFLGVIIWEHFAELTSSCVAVPFDKSSIIQRVRFPRVLLLFVAAWTQILIFVTRFLIFILFIFLFGINVQWSMFYVIVVVAQMSLLGLGVGGVLGSYVLKYRDIRHLWDVILTVLFWLTPIMYPYRIEAPILREFFRVFADIDVFSMMDWVSAFVRFQPLSVILFDARRALLYVDVTGIPTIAHAMGLTVLCLVIGLAGIALFHRRSRFFLEEY